MLDQCSTTAYITKMAEVSLLPLLVNRAIRFPVTLVSFGVRVCAAMTGKQTHVIRFLPVRLHAEPLTELSDQS